MEIKKNEYGSLCTEMYELLHPDAPEEELDFYLSYAKKEMRILEPMCGSGRFLIPFLQRGFQITGMDNSPDMLRRLRQKSPDAVFVQAELEEYQPPERFDYLFISSGSLSLFTDLCACQRVLGRIRDMLAPGGRFVFAVDAMGSRCPDSGEYRLAQSIELEKNERLTLRTRTRFDPVTRTQFSPGIYERHRGDELVQREYMDFQTHLYEQGEMDRMLQKAGFTGIQVYTSFQKDPVRSGEAEAPLFLYECGA